MNNSCCTYVNPFFPLFNCLGKSKKGELSIFPKTFVVLSHCLHMMPRAKSAAAAADNANLKVKFISVGV